MTRIAETAMPVAWIARQRDCARKWVRQTLGVDKAIGFTILGRGWASFAGLVTVILIARFLTPEEQGYYFTFGSLIALQIVFELGFSFVILQMASHERAHLTISLDGAISGDAVAHARLASVLQKAVRWYATAAILLAAFLLSAGSYFFSVHHQGGSAVHWHIPWLADVLAAMLTFQLDPILSFMEGCGFVSNVAHVRLVQAVVGSSLAWLILAAHHGLFAPAMVIGGNASVSSIWLFRQRNLLFPLLRHKPNEHKIHWMKEVWPFQWRIAVSWLCGYFLFQMFNPVLFAFRGAIAAGQMGMSLSLANALQAVAVSWISTKAAPFGFLIARKDFKQLDRLFFHAIRQAVFVSISGALIAWLGCIYINERHYKFAHRLLDPSLQAILFLSAIINVVIFSQAFYLRAHKEEKFLLNSVVGAITVGLSTFFLGRSYGAAGMVIGYTVLNITGLAWATLVFVKYRRLWHAE